MAIITITRGVQSGGRELAHRLADQLEYRCMSREVITENVPENTTSWKMIFTKNWLRHLVYGNDLSQQHRRYLIYIQCSLIEFAKHDNIVYHGYAGQLFLKDVQHALKIRLDAPMETRIQAEMKEYGKDRKSAKEYIEKKDEERKPLD